jgi:hypothetical protein
VLLGHTKWDEDEDEDDEDDDDEEEEMMKMKMRMKMVEETLPDASQVHVQVPTSEGDLHHRILAVEARRCRAACRG